MRYKPFARGVNLSMLGMGAMRLPQIEKGFAKPIDMPLAQTMIDILYAKCVNYYDTAYVYHEGNSEVFLAQGFKKILSKTLSI